MTIDLALFYKFLLLFLRASFFIVFSPVVGSRSVPAVAKAGLSLFLAVAVISRQGNVPLPGTLLWLVLDVARELMLGAAMGFAARIVFDGIQLGGQYVGYMMGLAIVNVMDPQSEASVPLISHFENLVAILVFLSVGGHFWFLWAFTDSLKVVPLEGLSMGVKWGLFLFNLGKTLFTIAIKVNAPIFVVLFLIQLVMAISARVVPQMNIFMVGFPLQIFVGLVLLAFSIRGMVWLFSREFLTAKLHMYKILKLFAG